MEMWDWLGVQGGRMANRNSKNKTGLGDLRKAMKK